MNAARNQAGQFGTYDSYRCLHLAPAPADFSQRPQDPFHLIHQVDEVCLSVDNNTRDSIAHAIRGALMQVNGWSAAMLFLYVIAMSIALLTGSLDGEMFSTGNQFFFWLWAPVEIFFLIVLFYSHRQRVRLYQNSYPVLFNRQRREVLMPMRADAYAPKKEQKRNLNRGNIHTNFMLLPWDELHACIIKNTLYTGHGMMSYGGLVLSGYQQDKYPNFKAQLSVGGESEGLGLLFWQYLYDYMEKGPDAVPSPNQGEEHTAVAHYRAINCARKQKAATGDKEARLDYWLESFINYFGLGSLPYHLADHIANQPRAKWPEWVKEWKKPLPKEQWTKRKAAIQVIDENNAEQLLQGI